MQGKIAFCFLKITSPLIQDIWSFSFSFVLHKSSNSFNFFLMFLSPPLYSFFSALSCTLSNFSVPFWKLESPNWAQNPNKGHVYAKYSSRQSFLSLEWQPTLSRLLGSLTVLKSSHLRRRPRAQTSGMWSACTYESNLLPLSILSGEWGHVPRISRGLILMCLIRGPRGASTQLAFGRKPWCLNLQEIDR